MTTTHRRQLNTVRRLIAGLFALCYLWMATGGVVHHTDDLRVHASASSHVVLSHVGITLPAADLCAACEWDSILSPLPSLSAPLTLLLGSRGALVTPLSRPTLLRPVLCHGDRAPPVLS